MQKSATMAHPRQAFDPWPMHFAFQNKVAAVLLPPYFMVCPKYADSYNYWETGILEAEDSFISQVISKLHPNTLAFTRVLF